MGVFRNDEGVRQLFGNGAFRKLKALVSDCCSTSDGGQLIQIPVDNYGFNPNNQNIYLQYTSDFASNTVNLDVLSVAGLSIGAKLTIFCKGTGNINLNSNFYYTECGSQQASITIEDRKAATFIFDGEKYCLTFDNC